MQRIQDENCILAMEAMVFDKISFIRKDFKSDKEPEFSFQVIAGKKNNEDVYKVTLVLYVKKEREYEIEISLSGFFTVNMDVANENIDVRELINKNTVAILMPYVRSELTLLTAQPDMDSIVLPPINVNAMLEQARQEE